MLHKIMIEQGADYAIISLNDRSRSAAQEKKGMYVGTWRETDDTSTGQAFGLKKDNLPQEFELMLQTLTIGSRSTSQGSHKEGEDPYFYPLIKLNSVTREASGKLGTSGDGVLNAGAGPLKKGPIKWTVVRYEF